MAGFIGSLECIGFDSCLESDDHLQYRNSKDTLYITTRQIHDTLGNTGYYMRLTNHEPCTVDCPELSKEAIIDTLISVYKYPAAVAYTRQHKIDSILK